MGLAGLKIAMSSSDDSSSDSSFKIISVTTSSKPSFELISSTASFYAVINGRRPGVYASRFECEAQVRNWPGAEYSEFFARQSAEEHLYSKVVIAYVDGSCFKDRMSVVRAGWGIYFENPELRRLNRCGRVPGIKQSSSRGELVALIRALQIAPRDDRQLILFSDSEYALKAAKELLPLWRRRGWRNPHGKPMVDQDLVIQLDYELRKRLSNPRLLKVRAHVGVTGNELADRLAKQGAELVDKVSPKDRSRHLLAH